MSTSPQRAQRGAEANEINALTESIIGAAMKVHSALGPGLLESAYEACLAHLLRRRGFHVQTQLELPLVFEGVRIDAGYRIDMVVNDSVLLELKCVEKIASVHEAQIISYLRLSKKNVALLINFHVRHLRDGIRRFVEGTSGIDPR